jgi:hypothetical protein
MDLYDNNHEAQIYTATDFIEFVIDNAKTKMSSFYLDNEFKELNTIEKLKKSMFMPHPQLCSFCESHNF